MASVIVLIVTVWVAFALSIAADTLPALGWLRFPHWMMWGGAIALIAWCMDSGESPMD